MFVLPEQAHVEIVLSVCKLHLTHVHFIGTRYFLLPIKTRRFGGFSKACRVALRSVCRVLQFSFWQRDRCFHA